MITKPMLAISGTSLRFDSYYLATPKFDGIRALKINGELVSRTLKPIRNKFIKECLSLLPDGADGELIAGNFQETTTAVMTITGEPGFCYYWFDYVKSNLNTSYENRVKDLVEFQDIDRVFKVIPVPIYTVKELETFEKTCLINGFEGICLRTPNSPYKCGRSTLKEEYLVKIKKFEDGEAIVVGFKELMHNNNPAETDLLGNTVRGQHQEFKQKVDTLGALLVKELKSGILFDIGTGFLAKVRKHIWEHQNEWLGKIVKYKYFDKGVKDKPRFPVFLGERNKEDIGE